MGGHRDIHPRHSVLDLTCHLSSVELGQDPTVATLPDQQHEIYMEKPNEKFGSRGTQRFPDVRDYDDGRSWHTIDLPIWTSVSLLGRGTSVWLVRENGAGPVLVYEKYMAECFSGLRIHDIGVYTA